MRKRTLALLTLSLTSLLSAAQADKLDTVKKRGKLVCGVNDKLPGFGFLDSNGKYSGFDVDFCKAVAAAVLGDASKVQYVPLTAAVRFTAVQSGEVDVVFRNTTYTSSRDGEVGMDFGPVTFYDGQAVMVMSKSPVKKITDLDGATICTNQGTTTEQNITDYFRLKKKQFKLLTFQDFDKVMAAFDQGRCDAVTTDASGLASRRAAAKDPSDYRILPETISKEPLTPFVAQGDSQWRDIITWVVYATLNAEEFKITQKNIDTFKTSADPNIRRFLGLENNGAKGFGLANDFAVDVIKAVGNYGEIYERNLGKKTKLNIPRGLNKLYTQGGLMYGVPFR
ncbi:amino acid ABC transporter substrate-binding protein [Deinococcus cellulosilyticus]|uniref:Amino acid ABC transporter substrate-binding protein n=1 Tax=Deinococcus cellulosilyticus (strain DSM 18568 / NBRC 106333 / KACC 11606 / 5516J-15) TaxID=1223518 RepID=A0A511N0L5_DEIC1|nr:amino acid ABC transporter substrate-binding protein [Deinococcus cellulosilyticus]GEM45998.1 amino acid ABC transporter substrate-binding protein [Deinococcus cellulosilyticus NBRC 106333 = KACC 11606]